MHQIGKQSAKKVKMAIFGLHYTKVSSFFMPIIWMIILKMDQDVFFKYVNVYYKNLL